MRYFNVIWFLNTLFILSCNTHEMNNLDDAYKQLNKVKSNRIARINDYLDELKAEAGTISSDTALQAYFITLKQATAISDRYATERNLIYRHIKYYPLFYNMFFVDTSGHVFHSIIKSASRANIFNKSFWLSLNNQKVLPTEFFIDFKNDNEFINPSAFIVEPMVKEGEIIGYVVLQVLINKLNNIVAHIDSWSQTGEVLLINKSQLILNNPRFSPHETILKQRIPKENLVKKFDLKKGCSEVTDYRNKQVLTSFETLNFMNTEWLISAKIDKDEVLTLIYKNKPDKYSDAILKPAVKPLKRINTIAFNGDVKHVLMDEFKRLDTEGILYTQSIHTCTGFLVRKAGEFAYLAHISPVDAAYNNTGTALVNQVMQQVEQKEIIRSALHDLDIVIVAPYPDAVQNIICNLVDRGVFLSQITVITNPNAVFADVAFDFTENKTMVYWKMNLRDNHYFLQYPDTNDILINTISWPLLMNN